MGGLEDEISRIREEIGALEAFPVPDEFPEERYQELARLLWDGEEVPDELLGEEGEGKVVTLRDYVPVLREMLDEGYFDAEIEEMLDAETEDD